MATLDYTEGAGEITPRALTLPVSRGLQSAGGLPLKRVSRVLRFKTELSVDAIQALSNQEAWDLIYKSIAQKKPTENRTRGE